MLSSFVALGDSFTEGMADPRHDGTYRGWADRVAERLALEHDGFAYANLAIRGRLLGPIVDEQVPVAAAMGAELVSLAGGTNDMLRTGFDADRLGAQLRSAVATLTAAGSRVLLFRGGDPRGRGAWGKRLVPKVVALNNHVLALATEFDCVVVDLWSCRIWDDERLWAEDRLHLNAEGHRRVALAALEAVGLDIDEDWRRPLPVASPTPWRAQRVADAQWARRHLAPWVMRRVRGQSSGDQVEPKRPVLTPLG